MHTCVYTCIASMADCEDVCSTCSVKFTDLKCIIQCLECKKYFHGVCEGVPDLRGLHKKRWRCCKCRIASQEDTGVNVFDATIRACKRSKCENGDMIEVDRLTFENLVTLVNQLSVNINEVKKQLTSVQLENTRLVEMVSSIVKADTSLSISAHSSYSSALKTNQHQVNGSDLIKPVNNDNASAFDFNKSKEAPVKITNNLRKSTDKPNSISETGPASDETVSGFQKVIRKKSKFSKPVIGTKETLNGDNSSAENSTLHGAQRRSWIYVGRIKGGTSSESIIKYVESTFKISAVKCYELRKGEELCSFKVGVFESQVPALLLPENWPKYVAVRAFVNFPRSRPGHKPEMKPVDIEKNLEANTNKDFQSQPDAPMIT